MKIITINNKQYIDNGDGGLTLLSAYQPEISVTKEEFNEVDRPSHYCEGRQFEPISVIEDWGLGFCTGNALKYISRAGRKTSGKLNDKDKEIQDLHKAIWYLNRRIIELNENLCD